MIKPFIKPRLVELIRCFFLLSYLTVEGGRVEIVDELLHPSLHESLSQNLKLQTVCFFPTSIQGCLVGHDSLERSVGRHWGKCTHIVELSAKMYHLACCRQISRGSKVYFLHETRDDTQNG